MHRLLIKNRSSLLWFVWEAPGYRIAVLFAKRAAIRQIQPHFHGKRRAAILGLRCFGGRKAAHMWPCFQVLLQRVCCILFGTYRKYILQMLLDVLCIMCVYYLAHFKLGYGVQGFILGGGGAFAPLGELLPPPRLLETLSLSPLATFSVCNTAACVWVHVCEYMCVSACV